MPKLWRKGLRSTGLRGWIAVPLFVVLSLSGCGLLLGPAPTSDRVSDISWFNEIIASGEISGLDAVIGSTGDVIASWIQDGTRLRISQQSGAGWKEYEGPSVTVSSAEAATHLAVDSDGTIAALFWNGSDMEIATWGTGGERHLALLTLEVETYGGERPSAWDPSSAALAFTSDGLLRAVVREAENDRLWLFLERLDGWILHPVEASEGIQSQIDMVMSAYDDVDLVFQATGGGVYYRWSESTGWTQRLDIPHSTPYLIRMRADGTSVLATRRLNKIYLAEERLSIEEGIPRWFLFEVVEHEDLYWRTIDLVLDDRGWPGVMHLLGPYRDRYFELWYSWLVGDGEWGRAQVATDLDLQNAFNPFNVRMVRDPEGRIHILLITGGVDASDTEQDPQLPRLLHLSSDESPLL